MYDKRKILIGLLIGVVLLLFPVYYNAGKAAKSGARALAGRCLRSSPGRLPPTDGPVLEPA